MAQKLNSKDSSTDWILVNAKEKAEARLAESRKKKEQAKTEEKNRRLVLLNITITEASFSSFRLRNLFNSAFQKAGQKELVVKSISKTISNNIVITTTDSFSS
jgi:transposase